MELKNKKDLAEQVVEEYIERINNIFALLVLSQAISDNISPEQVISRYKIEETPITPYFSDNQCVIESQIRIVPREIEVRIEEDKLLACKTSLLKAINNILNTIKGAYEIDSYKQQ